MHQLHRGAPPECLERHNRRKDDWRCVTDSERQSIWAELYAMQGQRCAYCEASIENGSQHIEHFRQRSRYQEGIFEWCNLFGSCNREKSCGKHKDRCGSYSPCDLIKPDDEDPEHFFRFVSDGTIAIRHDLSSHEKHRAEETLRILNLNSRDGGLCWERKKAVAGYIQTGDELREMAELGIDVSKDFDKELKAIEDLPFSTAIKHILQS